MDMNLQDLYLFIFIMVRVGSIMVLAPFFSTSFIPNLVKISLVFLISFLLMNSKIDFTEVMNTSDLLFFIIHEVAIGLLIGLISSIIFQASQVAGNLLDFSGGLSMAQTYSPLTGGRASIYGRLFGMIALTVFVIIDGPMIYLHLLADSYELVPNVNEITTQGALIFVAQSVGSCVSIGVQIAIPFVVMFLISDITLGLISRTIPQINVFILGIPMRFLVGIIMVSILATSLVANFEELARFMFETIEEFFIALQ